MTTEIERVATAPITQAARSAFQAEQVAVIRDTVARDCSPAELHMFLEIAARHGLDPFLGQIYAAKMGNQDGGGGRVTIMVPRDGFLAKANEREDFEGMEGDVVRDKDQFKVTHSREGVEVEHSYQGHVDEEQRGAIKGAWALVYRTGRKPTYFYAPLGEYRPTSERKLKFTPWGKQESAMILKCAESTCLRKAFSITGVVGAEEASRIGESNGESAEPEVEWGEDPVVREMVQAHFDRVNELQPGAYKPAKVRVMLRGKSDDERRELVATLVEEIEALGGTPPEPDVIEAEGEEVEAEAG